MWTEQHGNKYRMIERVIDPATGAYKRFSVPMDKNTAQARKTAYDALQRKINAFISTPIRQNETAGTLTELAAEYIQYQRSTGLKRSTVDRNQRQLRKCIEIIGNAPLDRLSASFIRQRLIQSGEPSERLNERMTRLRACLNWASSEDIIPPIMLKPFPAQSVNERIKDKYMERSELVAVLDAMTVEKWRLLTAFLALSGVRIGEAQALLNTDISGGYIDISKTYDRINDEVTTPKTRTSYRQIYIQPELQTIIDGINTINKQDKVKCPLLFHNNGFPVHYDAFRQYFGDITEKTINRRLTPHALRHTMTSLFAEQGVSLDAISRRLGDTSAITKRVYLHTTLEQRKRDNMEFEKVRLLS